MAKKRVYRFKGTEGEPISEADAKKWIQSHQDYHAIRAHFYGKETLMKILDQDNCVGIRFYHAIDDNGQKQLVLLGVDAKGENIWLPKTKGFAKSKVTLSKVVGAYDGGFPCPPFCGTGNP